MKALFVLIFAILVRVWVAAPATYAVWHLTGSLYSLAILAPWLGFVLHILSIRWDSEPTQGSPGKPTPPTIRGDGHFLKWVYQTPDERYPGGTYEPTVAAWLEKYGKTICSYLWAGERNVANGLAAWLGHESTDYIPDPFSTDRDRTGWSNSGKVWTFTRGSDVQTWRKIGSVYLVTGFQVIRLPDGRFWAMPTITFKKQP